MTKSDAQNIRPIARNPRGFNDVRGENIDRAQNIIHAVQKVHKLWGYEKLETGAFEFADCLGKFLPDDDRPNAGVFAIQDDDETWMALRYDLTAPLARFVAQNYDGLPKPFRRSAAGPVWRNEKPGPGRFREFWQVDADIVGSARPEADAEIIAMGTMALEAAGIDRGTYAMKISNRKLLDGLLQSLGLGTDDTNTRLIILRAIDKLDRLGEAGVADLLGAGRKDSSGDFTKGAGLNGLQIEKVLAFTQTRRSSRTQTLDAISNTIGNTAIGAEGVEELLKISIALNAMGISDTQAIFDPAIVRGLEYYTGTVFETDFLMETKDEKGANVQFGSIGSGGRYDDLVMRFRGERVPATGYSIGVSRLIAALDCANIKCMEAVGPVVILCLDNEEIAGYFKMAAELHAIGIDAEVYLGAAGMKAQMKYADRRKSPLVIIEGSQERESGNVTLKDLALGNQLAQNIKDNEEWRNAARAQSIVPRAELAQRVKQILSQNK